MSERHVPATDYGSGNRPMTDDKGRFIVVELDKRKRHPMSGHFMSKRGPGPLATAAVLDEWTCVACGQTEAEIKEAQRRGIN